MMNRSSRGVVVAAAAVAVAAAGGVAALTAIVWLRRAPSSPRVPLLPFASYEEVLEALSALEAERALWWTPRCSAFVEDLRRANPRAVRELAAAAPRRFPVIVFEGLDGVGKSSTSARVAAALGATLLSTPGAANEDVRALFRANAPRKLCSAFHLASNYVGAAQIVGAAAKGPVVVDRWWYSSCAYATKPDQPPPLDCELRWPRDLPKCDMAFLLTADDAVRQRRVSLRDGAALGVEERELQDAARRSSVLGTYRRFVDPPLIEVDTAPALDDVVAAVVRRISASDALHR